MEPQTQSNESPTQAKNRVRFVEHRTECKMGHPLSGANVRVQKQSQGRTGFRRICLKCSAQHNREYRIRLRAKAAVAKLEQES